MCRRQYKTYADGVFTASSATGPWSYAEYSPASHKPTGFLGGVGHSSTYANHRLHSYPRAACCLVDMACVFHVALDTVAVVCLSLDALLAAIEPRRRFPTAPLPCAGLRTLRARAGTYPPPRSTFATAPADTLSGGRRCTRCAGGSAGRWEWRRTWGIIRSTLTAAGPPAVRHLDHMRACHQCFLSAWHPERLLSAEFL